MSRWEKSAITRKENAAREIGINNLLPITKRQRRAIKDKSALVLEKGFQAIHAANVGADAKVRVVRGQIKIVSAGRTHNTIALPPDIERYLEAASRLFARFASRRLTVFLWTVEGRANQGFGSLNPLIDYIISKFPQYKELDKGWLLGLQYIVEGPKPPPRERDFSKIDFFP